MAKGQKRSNREAKKPKQKKPAPAASGSPFVTAPGKGGARPGPAEQKKPFSR